MEVACMAAFGSFLVGGCFLGLLSQFRFRSVIDIHLDELYGIYYEEKEEVFNNIEKINSVTERFVTNVDEEMCIFSQEIISKGDKVRKLKCGHYFKLENIDRWLKTNNMCPICRKNFL